MSEASNLSIPAATGRVGREDRAGAHDLEGLREGQPAPHQVADAFEPEEAGVPLVHVEHLGLPARR